MEKEHRYALRYDLKIEDKKGGYLKEECNQEYQGLSDALLLISIVYNENGDKSLLYLPSTKGKNINDKDLFDLMFCIGDNNIITSKEINPELRKIVKKMIDDIRNYMKKD
jgi:hypothetical protein